MCAASGNTTVQNGTLIVNGSQPLSPVIVSSGALLGGSGVVANTTASGGMVSPGNSPGLLHSKNVAWTSNAKFKVELNGSTPGASYDQLDVKGTVNLGIAGTSTLSMLGAFREYVEPVRPPLVLWVINANTVDSWHELEDPVLARYLESGFRQGLMDRQAEVDRAWRDIAVGVQYEFDRRSLAIIKEAEDERFDNLLTLPRLRERLRLDAPLQRPPEPVDLSLFQRVVHMARETTLGWGGDFVVVIMPLYEDVVVRQMSSSQRHEHLAQVLRDDYATTQEEMSLGACSVAVPVRHRDEVVAALGLVVPSLKRDRPKLVTALTVAARGIGRALEFRPAEAPDRRGVS